MISWQRIALYIVTFHNYSSLKINTDDLFSTNMRYKFFLFLTGIAVSFIVTNKAFAQIANPVGELRSLTADDIWAQTLEGSYFNEFWNYQFYFDNGITVHAIYSTANFGSLKSPVTGVRLSVYYPDGSTYQLSREYPVERLIQDRDNYRFQLHPERDVFFEGKLPERHRIVINTLKDGVSYDVDLHLSNIQSGKKWSNGRYQIHDEQVGIYTHIPFAEVRGHVTINDNRQVVSGTAYMDHTFQNQTTTRLMNSGYRFVHHQDSDNWDIIYTMLPSKNNRDDRTIGFRLSKEGGTITHSGIHTILQFHRGTAFGDRLPRIIEFENNKNEVYRLSRSEDQEKFSVLEELNWIARRAARSFLGGEVVDYRGTAVLLETAHRPKEGHFNFFLIK